MATNHAGFATDTPIANSSKYAAEYQKDFDTAKKLQEFLKEDNKKAVAELIFYPIEREIPLPTIKTQEDFIQNWNDFFDATNTSKIIEASPEIVGWRGVMIDAGNIWFNDGKISTINMRTDHFNEKYTQEREKEYKTLHLNARHYETVKLECTTLKEHVRIHQNANKDIYLFTWKKDSPLSEKPLLSIKGNIDMQGSVGNTFYTFEDGSYKYTIDNSHYCEEPTCKTHFITFKNGQEISNEVCEKY